MKKTLSMFAVLSLLLPLLACAPQAEANAPEESISAPLTTHTTAGSAAAFSDVPAGAWYTQDVEFCVGQGLMDGTAPGVFSPDVPASRAVLVTALYRRAGSPAAGQDASFTDIPAAAAYRDAAGTPGSGGAGGAVPADRAGGAARRPGPASGAGGAASLAVDELDRAVRRDSRRYDGGMSIF